MATDWRTPDAQALFTAIRASRRTSRPSASSATCARSTSSATWPSAGRSSAAWMRASTTPRSRATPARAPPRSPGSPPGSITARAATRRADRPARRRERATRTHRSRDRDRLRLAVPNKGRMVEPTLRLLHDAGLVFEEHDRSLVSRVQNFELDILFVRTNDVIEFVGDGVADLGITGIDLLTETGANCRACASSATAGAGSPRPRPMTRLPDRRGPRRPPRRDGPPEHRTPVLRRP